MYALTGIACIACLFAFVASFQYGWPWWAYVLSALGAVVFFVWAPEEDD